MSNDLNNRPEQEAQLSETELARIIARDNDAFRYMPNPKHGEVLITQGVQALDEMTLRQLLMLVRTFDTFTEDNDPYGHHDFGSIAFAGTRYFWKIDLYDRSMTGYTPDPTDPEATYRVLTIMQASEY